MAESSFLFLIPDIGGFTKFVNSTESEHSRHLTAELLAVLVEAGRALQLRDLEGDAVFFTRPGEMPAPSEFMEQVEELYTAFHARLKAYARSRICDCGACRSAHSLTLKIIGHYGTASEITVGGLNKLHGKDVILVHRLLKNSVPVKEYVLLSEPAFSAWSEGARAAFSAALPVDTTREEPEGLEPLQTVYVPLDALQMDIPEPEPAPVLRRVDDPVTLQFRVAANSDTVYAGLYNLDLRTRWNKGVTRLDFDREKLHRLGTTHVCHFPDGALSFETVGATAEAGEAVLAEKAGPQAFLKSTGFLFRLRPDGDATQVTVEVHPEFTAAGAVAAPIVRHFLKKAAAKIRDGMTAAYGA